MKMVLTILLLALVTRASAQSSPVRMGTVKEGVYFLDGMFQTTIVELKDGRVLPCGLVHPRVLRGVGSSLRLVQGLGLDRLARRLRLTRLLPSTLRRLEPQTPRMAAKFSNALIAPSEQPAHGPPRYRVALLTGCVQDLVFSDVNRDTVEVLLANGCAVTPPVEPCCGSLHAHNGELELSRGPARKMIDLFPDRTTRSSRTPAAAGRICAACGL
jgi:hypothetical protein